MDLMAAYNGLKFAKDALQVTLGLKIETEAQAKILGALEKLGAAQDSLFELREELFRLQNDNASLREQLKMVEGMEEQRASYKLTRTDGGAYVYRYRRSEVFTAGGGDTPTHDACPRCFAKNEIQILQDGVDGVCVCPACGQGYQVDRIASR